MDSADGHREGFAVDWVLADRSMLCLLSEWDLSVTISPGWVGRYLFPGPLPSLSQLDSRKHEGARLMATHLLTECGQSTWRHLSKRAVFTYMCVCVEPCVLGVLLYVCCLCMPVYVLCV